MNEAPENKTAEGNLPSETPVENLGWEDKMVQLAKLRGEGNPPAEAKPAEERVPEPNDLYEPVHYPPLDSSSNESPNGNEPLASSGEARTEEVPSGSENIEAAPALEPVPEPVPAPEPAPEPAPAPEQNPDTSYPLQAQAPTEKTPQDEIKELQDQFRKMRTARAGIENDYRKGAVSKEYFETSIQSYERDRINLAKKVEEVWSNAGKTPQEINDKIFEILVEKENERYVEALRTDRGETWKDKAMDGLKTALGSKAFKWYLKQNKWVRLGVTTALATGIGFGVGSIAATGAVGYAGARLVRGAASFGAAGSVSKLLQNEKSFLSIEAINKIEKEEIETVKNSGLSLDEKSKKLAQIKEHYNTARRRRALAKTALTVGAGAGAGLLAGLSEHLVDSYGGSKVPEQTVRPEIEPSEPEEPSQGASELAPPSQAPAEADNPAEVGAKGKPEAESFFDDPSVLKHEVEAGDSRWNILNDTLENNEKINFKEFTPAQKTYILSALNNKIAQDPELYGLSFSGELEVGKEVDMTKLFENEDEVKSIFEKAKQTIAEGGQKEKLILENNAKIAAWVKEHPGENLDESKVSEILATKPKAEVLEKPHLSDEVASVSKEPAPAPEPDMSERVHSLENSKPEVEMVRSSIPDELERIKGREPVSAPPEIDVKDASSEQIEELQRARERLAELEGSTQVATAGGLGVAGAAVLTNIEDYKRKRDEQKTLEDIKRAKGGNDLEEFKEKQDVNPYVERSFSSDLESWKNESIKKSKGPTPIESALSKGVNEFFTEREGFSLTKTPGVQSKKWNFIRRLSFSKLLKYYTGDSNESGLKAEEMNELRKHEKYRDFVRHIQELIRIKTNGDVLLFKESDTIEDALRKVISHIHEQHHNPLRRAA